MSESKLEKKGRYQKYTQNWQNLITSSKNSSDVSEISRKLNSGFSFAISDEEYKTMKENRPEYVHYYFGVSDEGEFIILVIDDVSDDKRDFDKVLEKKTGNSLPELEKGELLLGLEKQIQIKKENSDVNLSALEALKRSFRWNISSENWLKFVMKDMTRENDEFFFPLMKNPFKDLENVFEPKNQKSRDASGFAHHFFGLKEIKEEDRTKANQRELKAEINSMSSYSMDIIITNLVDKNNLQDDIYGDVSWPFPYYYSKKELFETEKYFLIPEKK